MAGAIAVASAAKPRILIAIPNLAGGGAERMALALAGGLADLGHPVVLLLHEKEGPLAPLIPTNVTTVAYAEGDYRRSRLPGLLAFSIRHARQADILIAANEGRSGTLLLLAGALTRKPVIAWLHVDWRAFRSQVSWRTRSSLRLLKLATRLVAVSDGVREGIVALLPDLAQRTVTIPNGIPVADIRRKKDEALPAEHADWFKGPSIVGVGRLDHQKGFDILIRAVAELRKRGVQAHLTLVGQGGQRPALEALAGALGLADAVHFAGFQTNPYAYMARATVFALSSRYEGLPLVCAEALAAGAAVVAADCRSGPREILDDGKNGVLVAVEDHDALSHGLELVLTNEALRDDLRSRATDRAWQYDSQAAWGRWASLLAKVGR